MMPKERAAPLVAWWDYQDGPNGTKEEYAAEIAAAIADAERAAAERMRERLLSIFTATPETREELRQRLADVDGLDWTAFVPGLRAVVERMRERCAQVAENHECDMCGGMNGDPCEIAIAAEIRALPVEVPT